MLQSGHCWECDDFPAIVASVVVLAARWRRITDAISSQRQILERPTAKRSHELRQYSHEGKSDLARRMTNLFSPPDPTSFELDGKVTVLESRLIYTASDAGIKKDVAFVVE